MAASCRVAGTSASTRDGFGEQENAGARIALSGIATAGYKFDPSEAKGGGMLVDDKVYLGTGVRPVRGIFGNLRHR